MNVLIVEDNIIQLTGLKCFISNAFKDFNIFPVSCYDDAIAALDSHRIDIFLIDINLNEEHSGLDICEYLRGKSEYSQTPIIFITDITVPDLDVINKYHCINYFCKPYSEDVVIDAIKKAIERPVAKAEPVKLKDIYGIYFNLQPARLTYVKVEGHKKHIFTDCGDFIVTNTMFDNLMGCDDIPLIRCHKSYLVNPEFILTYDRATSYIRVSGCDENIPVGRKYKADLDLYLGEK